MDSASKNRCSLQWISFQIPKEGNIDPKHNSFAIVFSYATSTYKGKKKGRPLGLPFFYDYSIND